MAGNSRTSTIINQVTGEVRHAQVLVPVLGASSYTYAEATWSQALPAWIASHQRTFQFLGGAGTAHPRQPEERGDAGVPL